MSGKLPWMQFFPADWTRDTLSLSLSARGAWISLICAMWDAKPRGELTMSIEAYGRVLGVSKTKASAVIKELLDRKVCDCVTLGNGDVTLVCRRQVKDEKHRESTRCRVEKFRNAHVTSPRNGKVTPYISEVRSQKSEVREDKNSSPEVMAFDVFWKSYPKKIGKGAARKSFEKMKCAGKIEVIVQAIEKQRASDQWCKDSGQFIPHPATWLNQERWEDEVKVAVQARKPVVDKKNAYELTLPRVIESLRELKTTALTPANFQAGVNVLFDKYRDMPGIVKEALEIVG